MVAFGDNFGYGAWKQPKEPAQIDTQAVVRLWFSFRSFLFFWTGLGSGDIQSRAMKLVPFLAEIACGM